MIQLTRIVLVNWYLFEDEDIEIRGTTALSGPNGAGKSTILDAVQVVMTGNHGVWCSLNAIAQGDRQGKSRRTVRDYCLGLVTARE